MHADDDVFVDVKKIVEHLSTTREARCVFIFPYNIALTTSLYRDRLEIGTKIHLIALYLKKLPKNESACCLILIEHL